jgi:tetratricopeptide (TPR) repeat protein
MDFESDGGLYPYYRTSLVAGYSTEIPRVAGAEIVYCSHEVSIQGDVNLSGKLITGLRHHFYWKNAWNDGAWQPELRRLVGELTKELIRLGQVSKDINEYIEQQEVRCKALIKAVTGSVSSGNHPPVFDEIQDLCDTGNVDAALTLIGRWKSASLLENRLLLELYRIEIQILLNVKSFELALEMAKNLNEDHSSIAGDRYLLSQCYFLLEKYDEARTSLNTAIDEGYEIDIVRSIALAIAGKLGDSALVKRVRTK